ncbi:major facilitator superfamily multidrug-resistance, DHA1 sub-family [Pluteus cervinus]|uniref:Major facilitator superfamily multidrug-resistance, DHA1 sub-family n=1 Tax=Pluteus cervinus TaxID=181527 RepID=A0ACD3BAX7_9AGAR|nr:major facilitator superfamily multidrug-resistance, DHA1 sub-family [Pluteus cervinus]
MTLQSPQNSVERTPLPKFQLFIVLLIQFAEPVTATVIYPFVIPFVQETGITNGDEKKVGYYAGIVESVFFMAEALTVVYWGRASDYIGRRPVLLFGPLGLCLAMLGFGLSKGFWSLVVWRCLQGIFNGNIGVSKTVMAEITDSTNLADAIAMIPLMWSVGSTSGRVIGGIFTRPATQWPDIFGPTAFFHTHPYFLPCALAGSVAFLSGAFAFLGLKETHPRSLARERRRVEKARSSRDSSPQGSSTTNLLLETDCLDYGTIQSRSAESSNQDENIKAPPLRDLLVPDLVATLINLGFLTLSDMAAQVLVPLVYSTSIPLGGLGFTPYQIGTVLGIWGVVNALVQFSFLGKSIRIFGPRKMYIMSYSSLVLVFATYPLLSFLAKRAGRVDGAVWAVIVFQMMVTMAVSPAYGSIHVLVVSSAPSRETLGTTNGLAQGLGCLTRSLAPSFASSLFSLSIEKDLLGGNFVYCVLVAVVCVGIRTSLNLPKERKP